jgi:hypothetical protein
LSISIIPHLIYYLNVNHKIGKLFFKKFLESGLNGEIPYFNLFYTSLLDLIKDSLMKFFVSREVSILCDFIFNINLDILNEFLGDIIHRTEFLISSLNKLFFQYRFNSQLFQEKSNRDLILNIIFKNIAQANQTNRYEYLEILIFLFFALREIGDFTFFSHFISLLPFNTETINLFMIFLYHCPLSILEKTITQDILVFFKTITQSN